MTRVIAPFASKALRAARAIKEGNGPTPIELTSEQKRIARHLSWEGKTVLEIKNALGLTCSKSTIYNLLRKANIRTRRGPVYGESDGAFYRPRLKPKS